jgi:hypothetical protein
MKECGDRIELVKFLSAQHGTGNNAANEVHP